MWGNLRGRFSIHLPPNAAHRLILQAQRYKQRHGNHQSDRKQHLNGKGKCNRHIPYYRSRARTDELNGAGIFNLSSESSSISSLTANVTGGFNFKNTLDYSINTFSATSGVTTAGKVTLNSVGAVTQSQPITTAGLELLGTGSYTLTDASKSIGIIAANMTGAAASINYAGASGFTIGTVGSTTGITTTDGDISLSGSNSIMFSKWH